MEDAVVSTSSSLPQAADSNSAPGVGAAMVHAVSSDTVGPMTDTAAPEADEEVQKAALVAGASVASASGDRLSGRQVSLSPNFDIQKEEDDDVLMSMNEAPQTKPTSGNPEPEEAQARRSGRKRNSTTMVINGHVVKKTNNYVVNAERMVYGAFDEDKPKPKKVKPVVKADNKPKVPRQRPQYQVDRQLHNDIIKKRIYGKDNINRMNFMTLHSDALEPFVESKVIAHLRANKRNVKANAAAEEKTIVNVQPECVTSTLRDYQMVGLDWMVRMHLKGMPFILGDEMGLGKTLQTISLIAYLKEHIPNFTGPSLVICPLSVLYSWCNEVKKHAPSLKYFRFHASDPVQREEQKNEMMRGILAYDIVITTYEMAKAPNVASLIRSTYFNLLVLDEGHVIKSKESQISDAVRKIHSQNRVILTGTPLQNNLVELYSILNFLYPQYFTASTQFESCFDITKNTIDPIMLLKANKLLKLFMIRRLKGEVERLMPKKIETKILCPLSSTQIFWYKGFLMDQVESLVKMTDEEGQSTAGKGTMLRNLIMQLRKVALHPYLFPFAERDDVDSTSVEELVATSGKLAVLDKILMSMFKKGNRTCIFSQFTSMLNILEDYCVLRGWRYCRFDGGTPRAQRNHIINQFNAPNSDCFIFLMSTRSGGLGINLQTADTCILYDSDWNPQPDLQAMARVHRIGQKKTVHVYRLIGAGTVEERIVERAEKKLYLDQMVNSGNSNGHEMDDDMILSNQELLESLTFGSNAVFNATNELPTDEEIDKITDRARSEEDTEGLLKGGAAKKASDFDKDKELTDTRQFQGVDFRKLREEKEKMNNGSTKKNKFLDKIKTDWKELSTGVSLDDMGKGRRAKKSRLLQVESNNSGWGSKCVPVLKTNDYELNQGEPSSWGRETKAIKIVETKKAKAVFNHQDFCQICGEGGGELIMCPRCPVSVHSSCCGLHPDHFQSCSHHRCTKCEKSVTGAGGLIYRCEACPNAYCPDCLPDECVRHLGQTIPRFEELGFEGNPLYLYVHCSKQCEAIAKSELGFNPDSAKPQIPSRLDVSYAFGKDALGVKALNNMFKEKKQVASAPPKGTPSPRKGTRVSPRRAIASQPVGDVIDLTT